MERNLDRVLKLGGPNDDNGDVTVVIAMQLLLATLAGLLLLEARMRRDERLRREDLDRVQPGVVDFHPELIVAWDDEANYARQPRPCTRSLNSEKPDARRPLLVDSPAHQNQR